MAIESWDHMPAQQCNVLSSSFETSSFLHSRFPLFVGINHLQAEITLQSVHHVATRARQKKNHLGRSVQQEKNFLVVAAKCSFWGRGMNVF